MNQKTKILQARRSYGSAVHQRPSVNSFSFYFIILLVIAALFFSSCSASRSGYGCPTNNPAAKASYKR
jgi:hypothetical protein